MPFYYQIKRKRKEKSKERNIKLRKINKSKEKY